MSTQPVRRVIIRPLSNVIYFYPTWLTSIVCGLWVTFGSASAENPGVSGIIFTGMFFFNLTIVAFDFTRLMAVIVVLLGVILGLLAFIAPGFWTFLLGVLDQPLFMNATFYWVWAVGFSLMLGAVLVSSRFDYWEIKNNEILHHHGLMGDVERRASPGLRVSKEITDVMEYLLLGAGRLVLSPPGESRDIVIDNVVRIAKVEREMQDLLNTLRVDTIDFH